MSKRVAERTTLFDRIALAVCGAVTGYVTGLAFGWALFFFLGAVAGLIGPNPSTGRMFFYQLPIGVMSVSAIGCAVLPNQTAAFVAKIWHVVIALSRRS